MDNENKINDVFNEIQDIYLGTINIYKNKSLEWLEENYTSITILLKEHYNAAKKIYDNDSMDIDCKLIKLLQIRLSMKKEINFYLDNE